LTFFVGVADLNLSSIDLCMDALSAGSSLLSPVVVEVELVADSEHPPSGRRPASTALTRTSTAGLTDLSNIIIEPPSAEGRARLYSPRPSAGS
jgi:hypothetical protein